MKEVLRILRCKYFRLRMRKAQTRLAKIKLGQKLTFCELREDFSNYYNQLKSYNIDEYTTPLWNKYNRRLEKILLPFPPFPFLQVPTIMLTMFATAGGKWLEEELRFLKRKFSSRELKSLLEEDYAGDPLILNDTYLTSHTAIHNLSHLADFQEVTGADFDKIETIVEWGGGYGDLVKILKRLKNGKGTYIMIDTPLFSCLQWLYLATILGERNVFFLTDSDQRIKANKINILPLPLLDSQTIKADLFISTWALSESSKYSQDYVVKKDWFGAKHLLLAYQENRSDLDNPMRIGTLASKKGAQILAFAIDFIPGNYYAFL